LAASGAFEFDDVHEQSPFFRYMHLGRKTLLARGTSVVRFEIARGFGDFKSAGVTPRPNVRPVRHIGHRSFLAVGRVSAHQVSLAFWVFMFDGLERYEITSTLLPGRNRMTGENARKRRNENVKPKIISGG
jgi:hypothetical protein